MYLMSQKKQFNVRLDDELIEWLKTRSRKENRTVPAQLTYILEKEKNRVTVKERI